MLKPLRFLFFACIISISFCQSVYAQFPYNESFKNSTAPDISFGGSPAAYLTGGGIDPEGEGYLRLTDNTRNQKGFIFSKTDFPSANGLSIEVEYFTYGGSAADGITIFLFDAIAAAGSNVPTIGGFGGSLGYAQINTTSPVSPGLSKAYIGVGLDEYGNFSNPTEGRQGGVAGLSPSSVTIRGKGDGNAETADNYPFLTTVKTTTSFGFEIAGGLKRHPDPDDADYRKASIVMRPNPLGGYNISVKITLGNGVSHQVIDNYYYPEAAPALLRYGIASSTGDQDNFHEIRNVKITPYINDPPVAVADAVATPKNVPVLINTIENDTDLQGNATINKSTLVIKSNPTHGTLAIDPSFNVLYTPFLDYTGADSFTYTIRDNDGLESNIGTATIQITTALPPVAVNDAAITNTRVPVIIDIPANDSGGTLPLNPASVVIITNPANGTLLINQTNGKVTYTPTGSFHGKDSFVYTIKNSIGLVSNQATVSIDVRPAGTNDAVFTSINVPVNIDLKSNDVSKVNTIVVKKTDPVHGIVAIDVNGLAVYTPATGYFGSDLFTYTLRNPDGLESSTITVTIGITSPPIAVNDSGTTSFGIPITIDVPANDVDDIAIDRTTITIVTNPARGTVSVNPATGRVTYTPTSPGFTGSDTFVYKLKDNLGLESNLATVTITIRLQAKIGVAKSLVSTTLAVNGSYDVKLLFTIGNYGDDLLQNVNLEDDLRKAFEGATITVRSVTASGNLKVNNAYDGSTTTTLLQPGMVLAVGAKETVELTANIVLSTRDGLFLNSAVATAAGSDGTLVSDQSHDGLVPDPLIPKDVTQAEPTPIILVMQPVFVPGGFSPNNDGINDKLLVRHTFGKKTSLEIYNRWGNVVFKDKDYQNTWEGTCNQGIHVNEDVPDGTYYYIIVIDDTEKYVGYLTVSR